MADSRLNRIDAPAASPGSAGDVPEAIRRRYLVEREGGARLGFYVDATIRTPAFRDEGRRLTASRNDPRLVRDLVAIAEHRGWSRIEVRGETEFRRQVWLIGREAGLEVRGYRSTERDEQEFGRRRASKRTPEGPAPPRSPSAEGANGTRLRIVQAVVNAFVEQPERRAAILAAAGRTLHATHGRHRGAAIVEPARSRTR